MKFPDWNNKTRINLTSKYVVENDGYMLIHSGGYCSGSQIALNGNTVTYCHSTDSWTDGDMNFVPVKKGDIFTVVRLSGSSYANLYYMPFL